MRQYNPTLRLGVRVIYPSLYTKTVYPKVSIETVGCVHTNFYIARTLDLSASRTTKGAWSARTITAIRDPKKGNRPISDNRWFSPRNFSSFYLKGEIAEQLVISGVLLKPWTLVKPSPIDFPALFTGCVFICVLIGLSLTTSLLRSAGHAVSCCHVTWRKILRLKWRQVVAIRALFLFSFICFAMT